LTARKNSVATNAPKKQIENNGEKTRENWKSSWKSPKWNLALNPILQVA